MKRIWALIVVAVNVLTASLVTSLSYFYAVTPFTLDAGSTRRGWPLAWMTDWWSSWTTPPSSGSIFDPVAFLLDFLFWLTLLLVPSSLYYIAKTKRGFQNPNEDLLKNADLGLKLGLDSQNLIEQTA